MPPSLGRLPRSSKADRCQVKLDTDEEEEEEEEEEKKINENENRREYGAPCKSPTLSPQRRHDTTLTKYVRHNDTNKPIMTTTPKGIALMMWIHPSIHPSIPLHDKNTIYDISRESSAPTLSLPPCPPTISPRRRVNRPENPFPVNPFQPVITFNGRHETST